MKRQILLTTAFLCLAIFAFGQISDLAQFNELRLETNTKGLTILGTWALGNLTVGSIMASRTEGETKYFHQMNAGWGAINLAIAGFGYYSALSADASSFSLFETFQEQHQIQKVLMLNIGLDAAYMIGGAYLLERAKSDAANLERFRGFGKSIIMQGAFLFVFDIGFYIAHNLNNPKLEPFLGGLTFTGNGFHLVLNI
ncbi:MAG: hypothetical protein ACJAUH_001711 [Saprospiraceae bacterium]|jgi:hypothetical protein|tara:strand:- start:533 stop:1126 length:594 start_codon:yes stop_codon:yes gene_type:complete